MNFTKSMIDLAKEIRRRADSKDKPSVKMANPDLFVELKKIYKNTNDAVMKALIKEICQLAGEPWSSYLSDSTDHKQAPTKTYRGQSSSIDIPDQKKDKNKTAVSKKIYRGQVVTN